MPGANASQLWRLFSLGLRLRTALVLACEGVSPALFLARLAIGTGFAWAGPRGAGPGSGKLLRRRAPGTWAKLARPLLPAFCATRRTTQRLGATGRQAIPAGGETCGMFAGSWTRLRTGWAAGTKFSPWTKRPIPGRRRSAPLGRTI